MKRIPLAIVCALVLLTGLLSACSTGSGDDDDATPTTAVAEATATADDADPTATESGDDSAPTATEAETEATRPATTPTEADAADDATPTEDGTPSTGDAAIEAELREVIADTAELRGLEPQHEVPIEIISREQLNANMLAMLDEDTPAAEAAQTVRVLWLLRLIDDPGLDLRQLYVDLYSERALGYYDPELDELFLVSDADGLSGLAEYTMAHELVHTLQDQHYDLEKLRSEDLDADAFTAITALVEGDADNTATQYALRYMDPGEISDMVAEAGTLSSEVVDRAPTYIRESLFLPYVQGVAFAAQVIQAGGFARIDEAYADPPTSTEQILHPDKYLGERDDPQTVALPDLSAALAGWTTNNDDTDTIGEFDLEIMLRENGVAESRDGAAGWDGGQWALYEHGDDSLVIMATVWDSADDATEFGTDLRGALDAIGPAQNGIWDDGQGRFTALATGADGSVVYIASTDRAAVESALAALP
jgi:hypothetical protein